MLALMIAIVEIITMDFFASSVVYKPPFYLELYVGYTKNIGLYYNDVLSYESLKREGRRTLC